jgi:hypothetical protein
MLRGYLRHRTEGETFQPLTARHDLNKLQEFSATRNEFAYRASDR